MLSSDDRLRPVRSEIDHTTGITRVHTSDGEKYLPVYKEHRFPEPLVVRSIPTVGLVEISRRNELEFETKGALQEPFSVIFS